MLKKFNSEKLLRKIFYYVSPQMRFIIRRIYFFPNQLFGKKIKNVPPKGLIYTGSGDFLKQGIEWKLFFIENGLQPIHTFLDIGSGIGRIALGLTDYLEVEYQGFEAIESGVIWCKNNLSVKHKNFHFKYVSIYNDLYNSSGIDASKYKFEYPENKFDFAVSISVFTHMIDTEVQNYLHQSNLVLKENGILITTFFIMDKAAQNYMEITDSSFKFAYEFENYFLMDKNVKAANVCFKRDYLLSIIKNAGFEIIREIKGSWSGSPKKHYLGFQDILVLQKVKKIQMKGI
jgi:SAM-dependent methyltransferase